jgi:ankyrin repeat protein
MLAAVYNHVFIIEYLLQQGAKMEARDMQGTTALIYAATDGHVEAVEV